MTGRREGRVLVMAKAPVPGRAKTRLGATVGHAVAAELAAAALLDTLAACDEAFEDRHLALDGDFRGAVRSEEIVAALDGWAVVRQVGETFGERLVHAHRRVAEDTRGPVVQIGTDTPQLTAAQLRAALATIDDGAAGALGPATDGGWWLLALRDVAQAGVLASVPMSTPRTCADTRDAFAGAGVELALLPELSDVDTATDAAAVAALAPDSRFAAAWRRLR